jgi:hypothetical protein
VLCSELEWMKPLLNERNSHSLHILLKQKKTSDIIVQ